MLGNYHQYDEGQLKAARTQWQENLRKASRDYDRARHQEERDHANSRCGYAREELPSAILVAAAFGLPELPGIATQESVKDGVQISLLVAAALSLLHVIGSSETNRVSDLVQKATERLSGRASNE